MNTPRLVIALATAIIIASEALTPAQDVKRPIILNVTMSAAGDELTVNGSGFGTAPLVTIDGQAVPVLPGASDTQVTVITPAVLLTTPGTYRLTVVDSVSQVGEVFVVAGRAGIVPLVGVTQNGRTASTPEGSIVAPSAGAGMIAGSSSLGGPVGPLAPIEDSMTPFRTALGYQALNLNDATFGLNNTAVGHQALAGNSSGNGNTATGYRALVTNSTGVGNTANGSEALGGALLSGPFSAMSSYNTGSGYQALPSNTTGGSNTADGAFALYFMSTGSNNTAAGSGALWNVTGSGNTAVGAYAGGNATTGSENVFLGNGVGGTSADTHTIRIGRPYTGLFGQNQTFIAGVRGTSVSGAFPVVVDANGKLGTAEGSGNFGIGNPSPSAKLDVGGFIRSTSIDGAPAAGAGLEMLYFGGAGQIQAYDRDSSTHRILYVDGSPTVINGASGGNVGIGPGAPTAKLDVAGAIRSSGLQVPTSGAGIELLYNQGSGGIGSIDAFDRTSGVFKTLYLDGSMLIFNVQSGGNVGVGVVPTQPLQMKSGAYVSAGGVWTNASSRTLKDQIAELPASRALDAFAHLKPVTFVYKASPGESHVGFIAEDVPDLVATQDRKSLAAMDIVAVLTKVVQEQQQQLETQQVMISELQTRMGRMEGWLPPSEAH